MKKLLLIPFLLLVLAANSQLLTWTPDFIQEGSTPITITLDATKGNLGLKDYSPTSDVYVHIGCITSKSTGAGDWKYVKFTWGTATPAANAAWQGPNKWRYTINGGLRTFFNITDPNEKILKISILFRNGGGTKVARNADGSDMYVPVYDNGVYARIDDPFKQPTYIPIPETITKNLGDALSITAKSSLAGTLKIFFNGTQLASTSATSATVNTTISVNGDQQIIAEATSGGTTRRDTVNFVVAATPVADLPAGVKDGINYEQGDTSVTLVLYAPLKSSVFVLGDFNNWTQSSKYIMNRTPDGNRYWIRITGLTKGTEYAYQYLIDGTLKVADYNTEKVLDPWNDQYIPTTTYPDLKPYPTGKGSGIVSVLQTAKPAYNWKVKNFARPDKRNLIIYELHVRDFIAAQNWKTLKDTLTYLHRLGINCIELMPINEFEGNNSWGYNPSFYFAPDKAYGTETALKEFIDECHARGISVVIDIALNHSFGQSPMVQMYWDGANNRPASNSPWFNPVAKHAFNVGYDINHESAATQDFVKRVIDHWLINYKIDGIRWDLSKGFTQKQTCDNNGLNCNEGNMAAYDATRIAIWKKYNAYMQAASPGSYCILEHFANNDEEKELSSDGMMLWGNSNYNFNYATMGRNVGTDGNFEWGIYTQRGWSQPHLVTYMESHDEERLMYRNSIEGSNINSSHNTRTLPVASKRIGMAGAFWALIPGPKMMWQFGELAYDYSINYCQDGTIKDACRVDPKPIRWDYTSNPDRKALWDVFSKLINLRRTPQYLSTFTTGAITKDLGNSTGIKWMIVQDAALKVVVFGNFDVFARTATINFPNTGVWYNYLTGGTLNLTSTSYIKALQPGEYYVYLSKETVLPVELLSFTGRNTGKQTVLLEWSTSAEVNNKAFEIQRSSNGSNFETIGTVPASTALTSVKHYQFTDGQPFNGDNYYRLRQVDNDGQVHMSNVIKVNVQTAKLWQVYPNPVSASTALRITSDMKQLQVLLTDMSGKVIFRTMYTTASGGQQIALPVQNLSKGTYLLKITSDKGSSTEKLLVQ